MPRPYSYPRHSYAKIINGLKKKNNPILPPMHQYPPLHSPIPTPRRVTSIPTSGSMPGPTTPKMVACLTIITKRSQKPSSKKIKNNRSPSPATPTKAKASAPSKKNKTPQNQSPIKSRPTPSPLKTWSPPPLPPPRTATASNPLEIAPRTRTPPKTRNQASGFSHSGGRN